MTLTIRALLLLLGLLSVAPSKLNLPRVLLPLFKTSSTNFTLKTTDNGCYKWTLSRLDIIQIIPEDYDKELDCSSAVTLSTITREFNKNTVIVLVEEVVTKEVLRCDVIVDVITSLYIVTKTRQLCVEESPEIFEVRAYDEQGNEFSTLEGVEFTWTISSGKSHDVSVKNDVIRLTNFKDSRYEIPRTVQPLDSRGLTGHVVLLEGVKTGTANISAELPHVEYRHVPPATVQLNVIANLIIEPADTYVLQGDVIHYKLLQVKNGRFTEVSLPSAQYSLNIEDETVAQQRRPWAVETLSLGQTKLVLSDVNSKMSNIDDANYLPSVTLNVVTPMYMNLVLLPHRNWITALRMPNVIVAELYDKFKHKMHIGPYAIVKISFSDKFHSEEKSRNGSYVYGYARETGVIPVAGECSSVRTNDNRMISFDRITAQAEMIVYSGLSITPSEVILPWDPKESMKLDYQLNVTGGDGFYQWAISDPQVAVVTQNGVVKPRSIGQAKITASMQQNAAIQTEAKIKTLPPAHLKIVHNSVQAEVGSPIYLAVAMYYVDETSNSYRQHLFTDCTGFPFSVSLSSSEFVYTGNSSSDVRTPPDACTTISVVGTRSSNAQVTVSYISDGKLLKDVVTVSTYEPLRMLSPEKGKTVLSVGAQRYIVFSGGPTLGMDSRGLVFDYTESLLTVERVYGSGGAIDDDIIYVVTCQKVGDGVVTLKNLNPYAFEGMNSVGTTHSVKVICAHPINVRLSTEVSDAQLHACPPLLRAKNMVLDDRPITIRVSVLDEQGNEFDNATSLSVKWTLSNADLGDICFPGIIKLEEKDEIRYRLPLYHYQVIVPTSQTGSLEVTAKIYNYRKSWLKRLNIMWEDKMFKSGLQETLKLTLVHNIHVSSEDVTIFNHPQNIAKVYITYGSGFYKIFSDAEQAAQINYSDASKSVDIVPVSPATFTLTVRDECLNSDPILVSVQILRIADIQVDVLNKIEKGKSVNAYLTLIDSKGNVVTKQDMVNLKVEVDANIIRTDCSSNGRSDGHIVCSVAGFELGHVNLVFKAGMENSIVRSAPIRIQVYPPLQIYPRNITLIPGASMQLTTKGGPQPDCSVVFAVESDVISVDNGGNVIGSELGESYVTGKAIGVKADGKKVVYSVDTVRVNVVRLKGVRLKAPLSKIRSGAIMPIWVEGVPEQISPLVLGSMVEPSLTFKWDVTPSKLVRIGNAFEEAGMKVSDSDKLSMRIRALKSGHVTVSVKVTVPRSVVPVDHSGRFSDSVSIHIFDDLQIVNYPHSPMLLAPEMKYQLRTNKDEVAHIAYETVNGNSNKRDVLNVTKNGLITTHDHCGHSIMRVDATEDDELVDRVQLPIQVSRVQYMMLNFLPHVQINPESNVFGLPKGAKLSFYVSYHDNKGNQFTATPYDMKYQLNRIEKVRLSRDDNEFVLDLLDSGVSVIKVYDDSVDVFPEYVKMNVVSFVQPDNMKFTIGDFVCFQAFAVPKNSAHSCVWSSSNEHALSIDRETGFAVAKSKQNNVLISFSCSNNLQMVTTADVYALLKIEILASGVPNVSNNGKRVFVPLVLLNEIEDSIGRRKAIAEKSCATQRSKLYYPYTCDIAFDTGNAAVNLGAVFEAYPDHVDKYGHVCVIESRENGNASPSNVDETNVVLTVSWNRYRNTKITLPFRPAVAVPNTKLVITDQEPIETLRVDGVPSILAQIRVIASHEKYVTVTEESSDVKTTMKYSVYLRTAYLKLTSSAQPQMNVYVLSEATDQNISVPLHIDVHANQYVSPNYLTEQITYLTSEFLLKIVVSVIVGTFIYVVGLKIYNTVITKRTDDTYMFDMSRNRSHLDRTLSSPYQAYQGQSHNEIQFIYGRSPDNVMRRRN